jgi:hypothetical protein
MAETLAPPAGRRRAPAPGAPRDQTGVGRGPGSRPTGPRRIPAWRLLRAELAKIAVTPSWLGLLGLIAAASLAGLVALEQLQIYRGLPAAYLVLEAAALVGMPAIGLFAMTSDWANRSVMAAFLLEPRRWRVAAAKATAALLVAAALMTALAGALVAVAAGLAAHRGHPLDLGWAAGAPDPSRFVLAELASSVGVGLAMAFLGVAWGALVLSTPVAMAAVAAVALLPDLAILEVLGDGAALWLGPSAALRWAAASAPFGPWVATSAILWWLAPLAGGLWRQSRRDVR